MKLKPETIRKRCKVSLHHAKFLDLSGLELVKIENLDQCENLHWLKARNNNLQSDEGLENLKQLWYLDLSNNNICYLNALSRYLALGTVILSNNNLKWVDLEKIRHAHFLSISLHGNPCLDSDPYYRIHVIDCLPLIWELDGRLVTVMERLHVKQFFVDTALTSHPVRHKMGRTFRTTAIKNIGIMGVVSKQCKYIYSKFPMSETHTKHTDERRLRYLTHMTQEDILQWASELDKRDPILASICGNFLENLLEQRQADVERCNMFLLLLVISLEYQLPTSLMRSALHLSNLETIGTANIMSYFLLPPIHRTRIICLLLNAAKVDRDNNASNTGGLYPQLFMSLYYAVDRLIWISQTTETNQNNIKPAPYTSDFKALMAGEVVSLLINIPKFLHLLCVGDTGVASLILTATGSCSVVDDAQDQLIKAEDVFNELPLRQAHKKVKDMILKAIHNRMDSIDIKMSDIPVGDRYLALSDCLPIRPLHSVIWASEFLTKGQTIPKLDPPILNPAREAAKNKPQEPKIGDRLLLGPQVIGDITMLLKGDIALVKIDGVPVANGAIESKMKDSEAHYTYVDLRALCFAKDIGMWRPINTEGDKFTIHTVNSQKDETLKILATSNPNEDRHHGSKRFTQSARFSNEVNPAELRMKSAAICSFPNSREKNDEKTTPHILVKPFQDVLLLDGLTLFEEDSQLMNELQLEKNMNAANTESKQCNEQKEIVEQDLNTTHELNSEPLGFNASSEPIMEPKKCLWQNEILDSRDDVVENGFFLTGLQTEELGQKHSKSMNVDNIGIINDKPTDVFKKSELHNEIKVNMTNRSKQKTSKLGSIFPPPQRPSSPILHKEGNSFVLRLADANRWLAGGRDLYWEQIKQRPKSGHMPGWREGLPASMRKQRPKSAHPSFSSSYPSNSEFNRVMFVPSCSNCQNLRNVESRQSYSDMTLYGLDQNLQIIDNFGDLSQTDIDLADRDQLFVEGYKVLSREKSGRRKMSEENIYQNSYSHLLLNNFDSYSSFSDGFQKLNKISTRKVQSAKERKPGFKTIIPRNSSCSLVSKSLVDFFHQNAQQGLNAEMSGQFIPLAKQTGNEVIQVYIEGRSDPSTLTELNSQMHQ